MSKKPQHTEEETNMPATDLGTAPADAGNPLEDEGTTLGGVLMLRLVAPKEWIFANVVPKGAGYKQPVGQVVGKATGYFVKQGKLPDGTNSESVALTGSFALESLVTGEIMEGHTIYLPDNVSRRVAGTLDMLSEEDQKAGVILDVEISARNTGKMIPYEWVAVSYVKDKGSEILRDMLNNRRRHRARLSASVDAQPKLIEG